MYFTTSKHNFFWGGCFQFFTKNRPQKHKKRAILHTSQANEGARASPRPPGYATVPCPEAQNMYRSLQDFPDKPLEKK